MKTPEKKLNPINVRLSDSMRAELQEIAQSENRTLSNLIVTVLQQWIDERRQKTLARSPGESSAP